MFVKSKSFMIPLLVIVLFTFIYSTISFAPQPPAIPKWARPSGTELNILNGITAQKIAVEQLLQEGSFEQSTGRIGSSLFLGKILVTWGFIFWKGTIAVVDYDGKKYFVTAGHMFAYVDDESLVPLPNLKVLISIQGQVLEYRETDFTKNFIEDFAFRPAPENLKTDLILSKNLELTDQNELISYGFPLGNFFVSRGVLILQTPGAIIHNCRISTGSSGGPVILIKQGIKMLVGINILANALEEGNLNPKAVSYEVITTAIDKFESKL